MSLRQRWICTVCQLGVQRLATDPTMREEHVQAFEFVFEPNLAIETFPGVPQNPLLTMGSRPPKRRRGPVSIPQRMTDSMTVSVCTSESSDLFRTAELFQFMICVQVCSVDPRVAALRSSERFGTYFCCQGVMSPVYSCSQLLKVRLRSQLPLADCEWRNLAD